MPRRNLGRPSHTQTLLAAVAAPLIAVPFLVAPTAVASTEAAAVSGVEASADRSARASSETEPSTLGYQCDQGVCVIDPSVTGAQPKVLAAQGRFAGLTADGSKAAWSPTGTPGLVIAPVGGAGTTVYAEAVGNQPVISPDGTHALWQGVVPVNGYYYTYRLNIATGELVGVSACMCSVTHGWAGTVPIGTFPTDNGQPSQICKMGTEAETGTKSSCGGVLASDATGGLAFPDGSPDGKTFVAAVDPANGPSGSAKGPLMLYSASTGARIQQLTSDPADTSPTFSPDGKQVAFVREGSIMIVDIATGAERWVADGFSPSWGGKTAAPGPATPVSSTISIAGKKAKLTKKSVRVRLACTPDADCAGRGVLKLGKRTLAKGAVKVVAGRKGWRSLKLTKVGRTALRKGRSWKVVLRVKTSDSSTRKKLVLRRAKG